MVNTREQPWRFHLPQFRCFEAFISQAKNKTPDPNKLTKLQELDMLLPREIAGSPTRFRASFPPFAVANSALPNLHVHEAASCYSGRGALGKRKRWSWQPIMFSAKENCSASTCRNFKIKKHWACSSVRDSEIGYLGAVRDRAAEGSLLFDEAEKAHPRVLDILLQLLDAARLTVATGQTLDFSGFYVWLTSNIGCFRGGTGTTFHGGACSPKSRY